MVFRGQLDGRTTLASVKDTSVSLAVGSHWIAAWDLGGRLFSMWKHGHTFRRGLNGRVLHKWREDPCGAGVPPADRAPYDARSRVHLDGTEAHALADESAGVLRQVVASMTANPSTWTDGSGRHPDGRAISLFERCARFDARAAEDDAARFATVFAPVGILPPDQYLSIVLQATEGCSFGTCTFCDLYHQRYRVKSVDEFIGHVEAVRDYLGDSAILRGRSVFLGAANALAVPMERLLAFFETVDAVFREIAGWKPAPQGLRTCRPIHAFVDGFTGLHKTSEDYAMLASRGLRRVYIGLESGHDRLLAFVRKPATRDQAVATVRALKAGGVSVGVIVMAGLGGRRFSAGHIADTTTAINEMGLDAGDLLYFSDLVEVPGTAYPQLADAEDVRPLALDERLAQIAAIRERLEFPGAPPRAARYDVREFVY
jgi:hypothetical protein